MSTWFLACLIATVSALIATRAVMAIGISDSPDEARKLHKHVTPTSGGVGIMTGVFAGTTWLAWSGTLVLDQRIIACLAVSLFGGVLGLLDDIYVLGAKRKLAAMLVAVIGFAVLGARIETLELSPDIAVQLGVILGSLGTIFWLLVLVNTINFMDGANGMAMGCAAIGLFWLGALISLQTGSSEQSDALALLSWVGCGSCVGFLYWNAVQGRVFAGDSGALFVGLLCGTLGVLAVVSGVNPLCVATCFLPMVVDVILTVILRLRRRENVLTAHAQHAYQIAIRLGATHFATSSRYWLYTGICGLSAIVAQHQGGIAPVSVFIVMLALMCWVYVKLHLEIRAKYNAESPH